MTESFWKKYWFEMLVSIGFFVLGIVFLCFGATTAAIIYFVSSFCWLMTTLIGYNNMRVEALSKRVAELEKEIHKEE
jgi:hypothetical protein